MKKSKKFGGEIALLILLSLFFATCARKTPPEGALPKKKPETYLVRIKGIKIKVEVAKTEEERSEGLKYRDSLPKESGMLFIFEREGIYPFWMKDTKIPLDIAFINKAGVIIDIQSMEPFSTLPHSPSLPFLYALEVNRGFFQEKGIEIGDTVIIDKR